MVKRVVIDTDPGIDDALALILALRSPDLRVKGITTVNGNVPVEQATTNLFTLLKWIRPEPFPLVGKGPSSPLGKAALHARSVHGADGFGDLEGFLNQGGQPRYPQVVPPSGLANAPELLLELAARYDGELTVIALGPLTNLARALMMDPIRFKRIHHVIIMGGAIRLPGNVTPAAEFNIFADSHAAKLVFHSNLPITLVPLDVTEKVRLSRDDVENLSQEMETSLGRFVADLTSRAMARTEKTHGRAEVVLHDPLTVGVATDPSLVKLEPLHVEVVTESGPTEGMTLADLRPLRDGSKPNPNLQVALEVDAGRFRAFFEERICQKSL